MNGACSSDKSNPDVTVIVVNYNTGHLLGRMFAALKEATNALAAEIIVIDNASRDDSTALLRSKYSNVKLIENSNNVGFGRANNQAVHFARGRYILLLNTDAFVSPDTLQKTVDYMDEHPKCGVLGVKLVGEDGSLQPSCRYFPTPWNVFLTRTGLQRFFPRTRLVDDVSWDHASVRECDWVPGCYYLVRRAVIDNVGLFDPRYFLYYEEVDHCREVHRAGWSVVFYPFAQVIHLGGESAKSDGALSTSGRQISTLQLESEMLYFRKFFGLKGLLGSIFLAAFGDALRAVSGALRRADAKPAMRAIQHLRLSIKLLAATRFASRPTR